MVYRLRSFFCYITYGLSFIFKSSILILTFDEIIERKSFIETLGGEMVVNGKFNSIFGMTKKRYQLRKEMIISKGK